MKKTLRVAVIQVKSLNDNPAWNLENAAKYVEQVAAQGAQLVLAPELLATGYIFHSSIWKNAESKNGPTVQWLKELAAKFKIYLGASYLEKDKKHFFNTFVLMGPDGSEAIRVRKCRTPSFESYYFQAEKELPHVFDTDLGRIAVGICFENHLSFFLKSIFKQNADLLLMPHSAPAPVFISHFGRAFQKQISEIASYCAKQLGIPCVLSNKVGDLQTPVPLLPFLKARMRFCGLSSICDNQGAALEQLKDEEGVIVSDIIFDPEKKNKNEPKTHGYWVLKKPILIRLGGFFAFRMVQIFGKMSYKMRTLTHPSVFKEYR